LVQAHVSAANLMPEQKSALVKQLRYQAVEQTTLSSP
jgi:hypothetical protein